MAHNQEVGGSNPFPATKLSGVGRSRSIVCNTGKTALLGAFPPRLGASALLERSASHPFGTGEIGFENGMVVVKHVDYARMKELRGKSYTEIAAILHIPRNTVASRMYRLRQLLGLTKIDPEVQVRRQERDRARRRERDRHRQAAARGTVAPSQDEKAVVGLAVPHDEPCYDEPVALPSIDSLDATAVLDATDTSVSAPPTPLGQDKASACFHRMASTGQADAALPELLEPLEPEAEPETVMDSELADEDASILDVDAEQESGEITDESEREFHQSRGLTRNPVRKKAATPGVIKPVLPLTPTKAQIYEFLGQAVRNTR